MICISSGGNAGPTKNNIMSSKLLINTGILLLLLGIGSIAFIPISDTDTTFDTIRGGMAGLGLGLLTLGWMKRRQE